jgi:hypothetical protein
MDRAFYPTKMKRFIPALSLVIALNISAQNTIQITEKNSTVVIAANSSIDKVSIAQDDAKTFFDVKNTGSAPQTYKVRRYDMKLDANSSAYFCFGGNCLPADNPNSDPYTLNGGQSTSQIGADQLLEAHLQEMTTSLNHNTIRYTVYNTAVASDSIQFTIQYNRPTAIRENSADNAVKVFPNPSSSGVFNISTSSSGESLEVLNILGSVIYKQKKGAQETQLDLSSLPSGTYFVRLTNSSATRTEKLVISK